MAVGLVTCVNVTSMKKSRGLGDSIDKFTTKTGIKKVVKVVGNKLGVKDCGCDKRRDTLNRVFPYDKNKK